MVEPGAGMPKLMPKSDRFKLPLAENPIRAPVGSIGIDPQPPL